MELEREGIRGRWSAAAPGEARRELDRETGLEMGSRGVRLGEGWLVMELAVDGVLMLVTSLVADDATLPPALSILLRANEDRALLLLLSPSGLNPDPAPPAG